VLASGLLLSGALQQFSREALVSRHAAQRTLIAREPGPAGVVFVGPSAATVAPSLAAGTLSTLAGGMLFGRCAAAHILGVLSAPVLSAELAAAMGEVLGTRARPDLDLAASLSVLGPLIGLGCLVLLGLAGPRFAAHRFGGCDG